MRIVLTFLFLLALLPTTTRAADPEDIRFIAAHARPIIQFKDDETSHSSFLRNDGCVSFGITSIHRVVVYVDCNHNGVPDEIADLIGKVSNHQEEFDDLVQKTIMHLKAHPRRPPPANSRRLFAGISFKLRESAL